MPSGRAIVVTTMSGQTVEVINTDAEGRLVLGDAITYVQRNFKPATIIDLATLTGAILVSLGHEWAGLFSNDEDLVPISCRRRPPSSGDKLWRMPLAESFDRLYRFADRRHEERGPARGRIDHRGAVHPALRRERRPNGRMSTWPARPGPTKAAATYDKGATGYGVRLLDQYVADVLEK